MRLQEENQKEREVREAPGRPAGEVPPESEGEPLKPSDVTVSFLLTKEDYGEYCVEAVRAGIPPRDRILIRVLGACSILCGFGLAFLLQGDLWGIGWTACLELVGLVMLIWYDWILPTYVRASACGYMDRHREQLTSRTFVFGPSSFTYSSSGCSMEIPYEKLYGVLECREVLIVYLGADNSLYLPKRAVAEEDCGTVRAWLKKSLQEKFHQEGIR